MRFMSGSLRLLALSAAAALSLTACGGSDGVPPPSAGTYSIATHLGQPVVFKNNTGFQSQPFQMTIGYGSAAFHDPKDAANVLFTASDRGPNIDCEDVGDYPIDNKDFCGNLAGKIFPDPGFDPSIYKFQLGQSGGQNVATLLGTIALTDKNGKPITGLSNDLPDRPKDLTRVAATDNSVANTENAYTSDLQPLPFNQNGLDTEAMARLPDGSFWFGEEYAPSLVHVSASGQVLERVVPADSGVINPITGQSMSVCDALKNGTANAAAASYSVNCALPAILDLRSLNRGIENIAVSPDGRTLYFALQSPLANPSKDAYKISRNVRMATVSLNPDGSFGKVTGEYVYVLDTPDTFAPDVSTKQNDVKLSEMSVTPAGKLIQLERISKDTKLYQVDWSRATNLLGSKWDDRATQPSLEQQTDLAAAGVVPLSKTLVYNTATDNPAATSPGKVEGLAFLDASHFVLTTDNDFGLVSPQTFFYAANQAIGQ
ncbi:MAG: esterase-like activity of phytase family protein [Thiomonas sp.]|uniref:esterase-like activity of phytase family protein n=1 Tax=Thiomonas sp. TaxID=2047785 RepID=UPI002A36EBF3|nr:esterase-like activity of phytase family protein [Thiomonas sp.]MDY0331189.1 esterase-like activity of phytase family protein [Thiomonas sp.]